MEITIKDLCLKDKKKLRAMCMTIVNLQKEKIQAEEALEKERKLSSEKIDKLKKKNERLLNEISTLRAKISQNAAIIRDYQTKVEALSFEKEELQEKHEKEKDILKSDFAELKNTLNELREFNASIQKELQALKEKDEKIKLVEQSVQTTMSELSRISLQDTLRRTKKKEEILEFEFQKYLAQHKLLALSNDVTDHTELSDVEKDEQIDETDNASPELSNLELSKKMESLYEYEQSETELSDSDDDKSIFSEDSLLDVVQSMEAQQNFERLTLAQQSADALSNFDETEEKEQVTGPLWFKNEDD
jgi:myosin heavy subunit